MIKTKITLKNVPFPYASIFLKVLAVIKPPDFKKNCSGNIGLSQ